MSRPTDTSTAATREPDDLQDAVKRLLLAQRGVAASDGETYARVEFLGWYGTQQLVAGDVGDAERTFVEAVDLARGIDHPPSLVKTLGSRGMARLRLGRARCVRYSGGRRSSGVLRLATCQRKTMVHA